MKRMCSGMKKRIKKRAAAFTLAMIMLLSAASCEDHSEEAAGSSPEMAYPLLTENYFNGNDEQDSEDTFSTKTCGRRNDRFHFSL